MVTIEIPWRAPDAAFAPFADGRPFAALLRPGAEARDGEWAILAAGPKRTLELRGGVAIVDGAPVDDGAFDIAREWLAALKPPPYNDEVLAPPFRSGLLGFIGYEAARALEPSLDLPRTPYGLPDMALGLYDRSAAFHLPSRRAFVSAPDASEAARFAESLGDVAPAIDPDLCDQLDAPGDAGGRSRFEAAVADAIERILDGAFYQANLSRRPTLDVADDVCPFSLFRAIAARSDAPHLAFLQYTEGIVLSASPERFFKVWPDGADLMIAAEPIKGTRPRGITATEDARLAEELSADPKDRAENVMIADLLRNDLSRVCEDWSVHEDFICRRVSFRTVHHLVSRISGRLRSGLGAVDALRALFPCGSITGAPKIAAMAAIATYEGEGRGPYCGAIGYMDAGGAADFSVAIRTAIIDGRSGVLSAPVGCGVTLRSSPAREYDESRDKLRWLFPSSFGTAGR